MKTLLAILVIAFSAVGCATSRHHEADSPPWVITPEGYHARFVDQGSVTGGMLSLQKIYQLHAAAVDRAADELFARHAIPKATTHARAFEVAYSLIDNHSFEFGGIFACGQWIPGSNTIRVCLYRGITVNSLTLVPASSPVWQTRPGYSVPGSFVYGILEPGKEFPSMAHELGHAITGNPMFEH
jgi:hypothetical protein